MSTVNVTGSTIKSNVTGAGSLAGGVPSPNVTGGGRPSPNRGGSPFGPSPNVTGGPYRGDGNLGSSTPTSSIPSGRTTDFPGWTINEQGNWIYSPSGFGTPFSGLSNTTSGSQEGVTVASVSGGVQYYDVGGGNAGGQGAGGGGSGGGGGLGELIQGLSLQQIQASEWAQALHDDDIIQFDVDANGNLVNGRLIVDGQTGKAYTFGVAEGGYNFASAICLALQGFLIGRQAWQAAASGEGETASEGSCKWITYECGAWFINDKSGKHLVTSDGMTEETGPNLTRGDMLAKDWTVPPGANLSGISCRKEDFGAGQDLGELEPDFDVCDPPARL